jgi:hypothetical protein
LENVLEQEQESLLNKMRNMEVSLEGVQLSPAKSSVAQLGGFGAVSRCSSVLSCDPSRESDCTLESTWRQKVFTYVF